MATLEHLADLMTPEFIGPQSHDPNAGCSSTDYGVGLGLAQN